MLLAALLLFLLAGPSAAQTNAAVSCDSEAELLGSLHWHVVVPSVAPARVIALALGAPPFLCPAARSTDPADCNAELRPC